MSEQRPPRIVGYQDFTNGQRLVPWEHLRAAEMERDELKVELVQARTDAETTASLLQYRSGQVQVLKARIADLEYEIRRLNGEAA